MVLFNKIVVFISALRKTGLVFFIMLTFGIQLFVAPVKTNTPKTNAYSESGNATEFKMTMVHNFFFVERTRSLQSISEVHRLVSQALLSNRIKPIKCNYTGIILFHSLDNIINPVPIFIMGHALLN